MESRKRLPLVGWRKKNYALGWVALSLYAFFWLIGFEVSRAAESLFIICFIFAWYTEPDISIKWHKAFLLLLIFVLLQVSVYFFAVERFPDFSGDQVKGSRHLAKLFLCIAVAWWLRGSVTAAKYLLLLTLAGFIVSLLINSSVDEWRAGLQGMRVDFGYTNAQHTSLYFGLALIFGISWFASNIYQRPRPLMWCLSVLVVALGTAGILVTQTRAVWFALVVVVGVSIVVGGAVLLKQKSMALKRLYVWVPLAAFVCLLLFAGGMMKPIVEKRLAEEQSVFQSFEKGSLEDVPLTSIGVRIHTWIYALEKISERPLTGWGAESRKPLIDEGPFPAWLKKKYGHFHNAYLEIWLAYGALGFLALAILTSMIIKGSISLFRNGYASLGYGLLIAWLFFFIVNVFESYVIFQSGIHFYVLIGGVGMSFYLFGVRQRTYAAS